MQPLLRGLLDLLYPPRCEACGQLRCAPICPACRDRIIPIEPPRCEVCGEPFDPRAQGAPVCAACRPPNQRRFSRARSAASYEGALVPLIWRYKYECQQVLAAPLAQLMVEALAAGAADLDPGSVSMVCPVPLHPSRRRERGFNQSELLAEHVAAAIGRPLRPLLMRTRATVPQVDLPRRERAANVRGAFALREGEAAEGQCVLLIDDLFTTGATLEECARALRQAGAVEVRVFTLARPMPAWRRPAADARVATGKQ